MRKVIIRYETEEQLEQILMFCTRKKLKAEYSDKLPGRPADLGEKIKRWLKGRLSSGDVSVPMLMEEADKKGFKWSTVKKVARSMDIIRTIASRQTDAKWRL